MTDARATAAVQVDNDHARITRWDFAPGAATGFHRHDLDYAVVPNFLCCIAKLAFLH